MKKQNCISTFLHLLVCVPLLVGSFKGYANGSELNVENSILVDELSSKEVQQDESRLLQGVVVDESNVTLPGATVINKTSSAGAMTDAQGKFTMRVNNGDEIEISFVGYGTYKFTISDQTKNDLKIKLKAEELNMEEAVVVAFGSQKKESMVSSVTSVRAKDLKSSSSDLTSQFAGKIAGMIGWQTSGIPGVLNEDDMNTKFYIRGITSYQEGANTEPLILLDGVESSKLDLARINPDDIASFTVLKDATATAMYGARGANGVILVESKKGMDGQVYTTAYYEAVASHATSEIDIVDPITYMKAYNTASLNTDALAVPKYSLETIERTESGKYPDFVYPKNDWYDLMFKPMNVNHRAGVAIRGGSKILQYYASLNNIYDSGMLKTDQLNDFNVNIRNNTTSFRVNLSINLKAGINLNFTSNTNIDQYHGPLTDVTQVYGMAFRASPVDFAPVYPADDVYVWDKIRFGGTSSGSSNPYLEVHKGYMKKNRVSSSNRVEYIQKLDKITKGLEFRASASFSSIGYYSKGYTTTPAKYELTLDNYNFETGKHSLLELEPGDRTLKLDQNASGSSNNRQTQLEARLYHVAAWDDHQTALTLVGQANIYDNSSGGGSHPLNTYEQRNLGLSMRGTYGFKDKYFGELAFAVNGSERFAKSNRFGLFPSAGAAWIVTRENFMVNSSHWLSFLKLRASYGRVGNDGVIDNPRFVYVPTVGPASGQDPEPGGIEYSGWYISSYENKDINWEINEQVNLGTDVKLFGGVLEFNVDAYQQIRHNILSQRTTIPDHVGINPQFDNIGKTKTQGLDFSGKVQHQFDNGMWFILNGTVTYSKTKFLDFLEPVYKPVHQLREGQEISQQLGYIAEGLFRDQAEIDNSPYQDGSPQPGDIRYRDINGDNTIDAEDAVFIGYPETPRLIYGFSGNTAYKNFEFSFAFQGSGQRTFFIDPAGISPFISGSALLTDIYNDHWTPQNNKKQAFWPNMTTISVTEHNPYENRNTQSDNKKSTYFMRDVAFLRCTSLELAYYLPNNITHKLGCKSVKFYARANNPFIISNFKTWDVELGENGFNYPIQRTYAVGFNLSF